jgi:hypothetical protein
MTGGLPALPPGWTEHTAPTGHKYYYNASLKKSTYQRPTEPPTPQTPPTAPVIEQEPVIPNTALVRVKEKVDSLTEWSSEMTVEPEREEERQTARLMSDEMWKKLEDRPRKKYSTPSP